MITELRKSIFDKIGLFTPEAPLEDYYLMMQISKYSKMKFLNEILFSYRLHNTNTMNNLEKIKIITEKTLEYEQKILENVDFKKVKDDVREVYQKGAFIRKVGIPFIFEVLKYKKYNKDIKKLESKKYIKIFGIEINK